MNGRLKVVYSINPREESVEDVESERPLFWGRHLSPKPSRMLKWFFVLTAAAYNLIRILTSFAAAG